MASLTIRNLKDSTKSALRVRAAQGGRSMEDEVRRTLDASVETMGETVAVPGNLADAIAAIVDPLGGIILDIPPREPGREPPNFSGPEYDLRGPEYDR